MEGDANLATAFSLVALSYCGPHAAKLTCATDMNQSTTPSADPLVVENVTKRFRQGDTVFRPSGRPAHDRAGRVRGRDGGQRIGQEHLAARDGRPDPARRRPRARRWPGPGGHARPRPTVFRRRHVGLVFQAFNLIPTLTARDNVLLPLLADGRGGPRSSAPRSARAAEPHRPPAASARRPERRRAAARGHRPGRCHRAGDPAGRRADRQPRLDHRPGDLPAAEGTVRGAGRTVVVVTHEPAVAVWAERIVVLKDGRILTEFQTAEFRDVHLLAAHYQDIVGPTAHPDPRRRPGDEPMTFSGKLALAYAWRHPARMLLTSLATIASACVVVWVVSGYDALVGQFGSKAAEYLGRYDLFLVPDSAEDSLLPMDLVEAMHRDATIAEWEPALQWTRPREARPAAGRGRPVPAAAALPQPGRPGAGRRRTARPPTARNSSAWTRPSRPTRWPRDAGSTRTTPRSRSGPEQPIGRATGGRLGRRAAGDLRHQGISSHARRHRHAGRHGTD